MSYMPYQNLDGRQAWYTWSNKHYTIEKVEIETNKQYLVLESNTPPGCYINSRGLSTIRLNMFLDFLHLHFLAIHFFLVLFLHILWERI